MKDLFSRKLVAVGLSSLVVGIGATVGVFAAIPDSNTKLITACRNNFSGALKAIDAQSGASCGLFETSLVWSGDLTSPSSGGSKTAVFHATPDTSDPDFTYVYNPTFSRGILEVKKLVANDPVNNPGDFRGYCLELGFTVLYSNSNEAGQDVFYPASLEGTDLNIDTACGSGYDALIASSFSSGVPAGKREVFLSE